MNNDYITVGALTRYIKYKFDNDANLQNIAIKGEISNFKRHSRGHFYFTIKDEESRKYVKTNSNILLIIFISIIIGLAVLYGFILFLRTLRNKDRFIKIY